MTYSAGKAHQDQNTSRKQVHVKELTRRSRRLLLKHFLSPDQNDRLLRFGNPLDDDQITAYVDQINFLRDRIFGVYRQNLELLGVGHLAFGDPVRVEGNPGQPGKIRVAEFGLSVTYRARGLGVGSALFRRAVMHCRNANIQSLTMHCLSSNRTMMHIARKVGVEIEREAGEADAWLRLLPADPRSVMQEAMDEQMAVLRYTFHSRIGSVLRAIKQVFKKKK